MKNLVFSFLAAFLFLSLSFFITNANALELGGNITIYDGSSSEESGWHGKNEDDEVEPGCVADQVWDLEGFFLKGSELQVVGGFDFENGQGDFKIGDIFLDLDGDHNAHAISSTTTGYRDITENNMGYDYVIHLNFDNSSYSYSVYNIQDESDLELLSVYYSNTTNTNSNPFQYVSGGSQVTTGSFSYFSGLSDSDVGGLSGGTHYAMTGFDLSFIAGQEFTAHLTIGCGNDELMGQGTAPVPEPATIMLFGAGLIGIAGFGKRRFLKKG